MLTWVVEKAELAAEKAKTEDVRLIIITMAGAAGTSPPNPAHTTTQAKED